MISERYKFRDKYRVIGKLKRMFYRIRRAFWYYKRGKIINLETNGFFEDLFIINALQQVVYSKKINSFNVEISTNGIMPGMYFVIIKNQKNMAIKKLIIN